MNLQQKIMMRVYMIWLFRRVSPVVIFLVLFTILVLHLFAQSVFIVNVFENASIAYQQGGWGLIWFVFLALVSAKLAVKVEIIAMLIIGFFALKYARKALVAYDLIRRGHA